MCASEAKELRSGDYSFNLHLNPWQHPIFDKNIHHLFALLTALRTTCGGVIFLFADDNHSSVTQTTFQLYKERLGALLNRDPKSSSLSMNVIQVSLLLGPHKSWAALLVKQSIDAKKYPLVENKGIWKPTNFDINIFGTIHAKPTSVMQSQKKKENEASAGLLSGQETGNRLTTKSEGNPHQTSETNSLSAPPQVMVHDSNAETARPKVNFSSCQRLDWSENTKDWQKYVTTKEAIVDDIAGSCPMWKPTQPMKITPDKEFLSHLFDSETDLQKTLTAVSTNDPGYAIVCRTWKFHILDDETEVLPTGHICDILTVTSSSKLSFWVVVASHDGDKFEGQMEYLMTTGRMLKYLIVRKGTDADLSNLWIDCCLLFSPRQPPYRIQ